MAYYKCPYCHQNMSTHSGTVNHFYLSFDRNDNTIHLLDAIGSNSIIVTFYKCPECEKISIKCDGVSMDLKNLHVNILPQSTAIKFPDYIPLAIRQDYEEAHSILNLSPKASATLSRRCLQGMIRDFWGIKGKRLIDEINLLEEKIPTAQWKVLNGVRRIGNIGAHMESDVNVIVDIEPDEASKLIKLIEKLLNDWYVQRHDTEILYNDIIKIDEDKKAIKSSR